MPAAYSCLAAVAMGEGGVLRHVRPEPMARRAQRQAAGGKRRPSEHVFRSVRQWLDNDLFVETLEAYGPWAQKANDKLPPGSKPHLTKNGLLNTLTLPWSIVKRIARGELDADRFDAVEEHTLRDEEHVLVSLRGISRVTDRSHGHRHRASL